MILFSSLGLLEIGLDELKCMQCKNVSLFFGLDKGMQISGAVST